jgi:hypothetical protein
VLDIFAKIRIDDEDVRDWFRMVLGRILRILRLRGKAQRAELTRQEALLVAQQDRLLDIRLRDGFDQDAYAAKQMRLRDRRTSIKLKRNAVDRSHDEIADPASRVCNFATLTEKWLTADLLSRAPRLEIIFFNRTLEGVTPCPAIEKPFRPIGQRASSESRDDRI